MQILFNGAKTFFIPKQRPRKLIQFVGFMIMASDHCRRCNTNLNKLHVAKEKETVSSLFSLRGCFHDYRGLISSSQLLQSPGVSIIYPPATLPLWVILQPSTPHCKTGQDLRKEPLGARLDLVKVLKVSNKCQNASVMFKDPRKCLVPHQRNISQCQGPLDLPGSVYI